MAELDYSAQLRISRLYGSIILICAIAFPILVVLIPIIDSISTLEISWFEWVLLIMMPIDLIIVLILYTRFRQTTKIPFLGKTTLLYIMGVAPSIYGTILAFLNSILKYIGIILGLVCSLMSIGLVLISSPNMLSKKNEL